MFHSTREARPSRSSEWAGNLVLHTAGKYGWCLRGHDSGRVVWCGDSCLGPSVLFLGFSGSSLPFIWYLVCEPAVSTP